jgi:peptide-methionine (S)-S-oxide reductase
MPPKHTIPLAATTLGLVVVGVMWQASSIEQTYSAVLLPSPAVDEFVPSKPVGAPRSEEVAVFAGGCFWGMQAVFQHVAGVVAAVSGYTGGDTSNPTYDQVASGMTGHAEAVEVTFDPNVVSYGTLLKVYFSVAHDPTLYDRQGPDVGPQYRSEIFYSSTEQADVAKAYIVQLDAAEVYSGQIVTQVEPLQTFWRAEDAHQDYVAFHPSELYVVVNDLPKLTHLRNLFPDLWHGTPTLVHGAGT